MEQRVKKVQLVSSRGETSVYIDAEIDEKGDLVINGQDIGKAPKELFGDSDYEYWLRVAASDKDLVLQALLGRQAGPSTDASRDERDWALLNAIEKAYGGNSRVVSLVRDLLAASGIRYEFSTF